MIGLDVNAIDSRHSTPLHWATFAGADLALSFLVANGAELDAQDLKGLTPMHLAVKTSENMRTTRLIRGLLLKGADPQIQDHNGRLPVDFVEEFDINHLDAQEFAESIKELVGA